MNITLPTSEQKFAHLTKARGGRGYELIITDTPKPSLQYLAFYSCAGKREARKFAAEHNAKPWNF